MAMRGVEHVRMLTSVGGMSLVAGAFTHIGGLVVTYTSGTI